MDGDPLCQVIIKGILGHFPEFPGTDHLRGQVLKQGMGHGSEVIGGDDLQRVIFIVFVNTEDVAVIEHFPAGKVLLNGRGREGAAQDGLCLSVRSRGIPGDGGAAEGLADAADRVEPVGKEAGFPHVFGESIQHRFGMQGPVILKHGAGRVGRLDRGHVVGSVGQGHRLAQMRGHGQHGIQFFLLPADGIDGSIRTAGHEPL